MIKHFLIQAFEERVKTAQKDGTILMLHNLDPEYVSGEVEVILIYDGSFIVLLFVVNYIISPVY